MRPCTSPLNEPVAMYERRFGILIENFGVWSSSVKPPIWKAEKPHGWHVFHCASEAAIFMAGVGHGHAEAIADDELTA